MYKCWSSFFYGLQDGRGSFIAASNNNVDYDLDEATCEALASGKIWDLLSES
jgi:hypothetical protein